MRMRYCSLAMLGRVSASPMRRPIPRARSSWSFPSRPAAPPTRSRASSASSCRSRSASRSWSRTSPARKARSPPTEVARAAPDGYTLMVGTNTPLAANPSLFKKLNYDPVKDFAPIARLGTISFMIMVRPDFPAKNLKELLASCQEPIPGKLSAGYGSAGSQVSQAMLRSMGKIDFIDVPYKGLPQAITDVLGGQISFTFADLANALAQIKGGKLRGIAVTSQKRSALAPDVPAIAEELPGYELIAWFALVAPAGTPAPVVSRLHEVTVKSLAKPEVKARFDALGTDVAPMNPEQLGGFIRAEIAKWAKMAKEAGIQPE